MTNDTTPATDEQVEEIQLSYAHFNKIEIEDLAALCIRIYSDRARISALQSEITALRGLERAVNEYHRVFGLECLVCSECRGRCELEIYPDGECECCCHDISRASKGDI